MKVQVADLGNLEDANACLSVCEEQALLDDAHVCQVLIFIDWEWAWTLQE